MQNAKPGVGDVALILKHSVFRPGAPAFTTLIKSCGRAGAWEKACELYDAMKQRGVPANTITCSALINALGKSRQWERAIDVFTEMKQNGVEANIFTYSALISACAKGKRLDKALEMFEECVDAGVAPDAITYGAVISACEKGKRVDKALEIFDQMKNPKSEHTECNVITYNSLLGACERAGRHGDTMRVFAAMRNEGVRPDKVTFAAVIGATAGLGEFKKALDVFRNMTRDRVEPDVTTAAAALVACAGGGFAEDANAIYKEFVGKKTTADRSEDGGRREKETGANGRQGGRAGGGDVKDQSSSCGSSSHVALVTNALAAFEKANAWRHAVDVIGATCDLKQTAKARAVAVAADAAAVTLAAAALHVTGAGTGRGSRAHRRRGGRDESYQGRGWDCGSSGDERNARGFDSQPHRERGRDSVRLAAARVRHVVLRVRAKRAVPTGDGGFRRGAVRGRATRGAGTQRGTERWEHYF